MNGQGELGGGNGIVRGNGDHVGEGAEGGGGDGTDSNSFDGNGFYNAEKDGLEGGGLEIYWLKVTIWLLTLHVRQWQRVNYGSVVPLKTLQCELHRLKTKNRHVQIDVSTTVPKSSLRKLRRLILEKCQVEVSGAADGQKVCAERCDGAGRIAVEAPQTLVLFDQWKERSKRQARAAVSRAARDVARNRHVNSWRKGKKGGVGTAFQAAPMQGALFFSHMMMIAFITFKSSLVPLFEGL